MQPLLCVHLISSPHGNRLADPLNLLISIALNDQSDVSIKVALLSAFPTLNAAILSSHV